MISVIVTGIVDETDSIRCLRLARPDGQRLPPFTAGAHIDLTGPTGVTRPYSLCGPPHETGSYLVAVKRERPSRGGSAALHEQVELGSELTVGEPRNLFRLAPTATSSVLVAAGVGITPLLSMAHHLHREGQGFSLAYFARERAQAAFVDLLERAEFADRVRFHFGVPRGEQEAVISGVLSVPDADTHVYTCGPGEFMRRVVRLAGDRLPARNVHVEHFQGAEPPRTPGAAFELGLDTGESFAVPAHSSIVEVLEDHGVWVETSCREGICGTCVLPVIEGVPDHRDNCLTRSEKEANDRIAACVSRSRTARLVVEV